jgi:UDP-N-acetylmuramate: L-alanyl-gamma-D-glutamyl-meso-diaminopimelate ligase
VLLPPPEHGAGTHEQLTQPEIAARIHRAGTPTAAVAGRQAVLKQLDADLTGNEVLLLLSSGPLAGLADALPPVLDVRFG